MAVLFLPLGIELHHAKDHSHKHCDLTIEHLDSHEEDCSHMHFLSKVDAIDFDSLHEYLEVDFYCIERTTFYYLEKSPSFPLSSYKRGPPFLLL